MECDFQNTKSISLKRKSVLTTELLRVLIIKAIFFIIGCILYTITQLYIRKLKLFSISQQFALKLCVAYSIPVICALIQLWKLENAVNYLVP